MGLEGCVAVKKLLLIKNRQKGRKSNKEDAGCSQKNTQNTPESRRLRCVWDYLDGEKQKVQPPSKTELCRFLKN